MTAVKVTKIKYTFFFYTCSSSLQKMLVNLYYTILLPNPEFNILIILFSFSQNWVNIANNIHK